MKKEIIYDELLEKIPNKYVLAIVAGKRARDLVRGEDTKIKAGSKDTVVKKALLEVLNDKVGMGVKEEEK